MAISKKKKHIDLNTENSKFNSENYEYSLEKKQIHGNSTLLDKEKTHELVKAKRGETHHKISRQELRDLLEKNDDVDEITIESVKKNEASRYKINFQNQNRLDSPTLLLNFEKSINHEFLELKFNEKKVTKKNNLELVQTESLFNYEKHSLKKKCTKVATEELYYSIDNHKDLYNIGKSYLKDLSQGSKCFGICAVDSQNKSLENLVGLAAYFGYHTSLSVCSVMDLSDGLGPLEKYFSQESFSSNKNEETSGEPSLHHTDLMDIVDTADLVNSKFEIRNIIKHLYNKYDVIFILLPCTEKIDRQRTTYFPLVYTLDNINLIVKAKKTKFSKVRDAVEYFKKYDVFIKGVTF